MYDIASYRALRPSFSLIRVVEVKVFTISLMVKCLKDQQDSKLVSILGEGYIYLD